MGIGGLQVKKPIDKKVLKRPREQGLKLREIAAHFDCSIDDISVAIRRYGLPLRGGARPGGNDEPVLRGFVTLIQSVVEEWEAAFHRHRPSVDPRQFTCA